MPLRSLMALPLRYHDPVCWESTTISRTTESETLLTIETANILETLLIKLINPRNSIRTHLEHLYNSGKRQSINIIRKLILLNDYRSTRTISVNTNDQRILANSSNIFSYSANLLSLLPVVLHVHLETELRFPSFRVNYQNKQSS